MSIKRLHTIFLYAILLSAAAGCSSKMNERVTLWRNDKIPYGLYYAYNQLDYLFSGAEKETSVISPAIYGALHSSTDSDSAADTDEDGKEPRSAYLVVSAAMKPDEEEIRALFNYVSEGNYVFISALEIGQNLLDSLRLSTDLRSGFYNVADSLTLSVIHPVTFDSLSYAYPGKALDNYFSAMDSSITTILGRDAVGRADFVKFSYEGGGAIYLHLAPVAFTNFFLLHKNNKQYYDQTLSFIPADIKKLRWDDYYRRHSNGKTNEEFSKLRAFLNDKTLSWAFWLAILLFALIYIFESKRKQRIVPLVKPLANTSLDFVKTIGSLYYQRKDNKNLSAKMITHFLDHVRGRYNLPTSQLSEAFETSLAYKSGYDSRSVKEILNQLRTLELQYAVTDEELMSFNEKLDKFYKHT